MTVKLRMLGRLGDVAQLLHTAHVLHKRGYEVLIECHPKYADLLRCCSYVKYSHTFAPSPALTTFDLGIHPISGGTEERFKAYRKSGKRWREFVLDAHEILRGTYGPPIFDRTDWFSPADYSLPADGNYAVVCADGYSQQQKHNPEAVMALARQLYGNVPIYRLSDKPTTAPGFLHVRRLRDFPSLLKHARYVLSINSSAAIIAAGVRTKYHHISQTGAAAQDDTAFDGISEVVRVDSGPAKEAAASGKAPRYSISVLALNNLELTKRCVDSVFANSEDFELILTNNGSTDGTRAYFDKLAAKHSNIRVVHNEKNRGFWPANNAAFGISRGERFVMLNNDATVPAGWLAALDAPFTEFSTAALSCPRGGCSALADNFHGKHGPLEYCEGAALMVRSDVARTHGLFSTDLPGLAYGEDSDLSLRYRQLGLSIHHVDIRVEHKRAATSKKLPEVAKWQADNHAFLRRKWSHYLNARRFDYVTVVKRRAAWGDVLLTTPIIRALREQRPLSPIWVETDCAAVFDRSPYVARVAKAFPIPPDAHVIDLDMASENRLETHFVDAYAEVAGLTKYDKRTELFCSQADHDWAARHMRGNNWIAVHAGPVSWPSKQWPEERFTELLRELGSEASIALVGSPAAITYPCDLDLRGKTTVHQMAAVIKRCRLFVGLDSFPLHCAAAMNTPSIGLFGVTSGAYILTADNAVAVEPDAALYPTHGMRHRVSGQTIVDDGGTAIRGISVEQVVDAAMGVLV